MKTGAHKSSSTVKFLFVVKKCSANGLCWLNTCTRETGLSQWVVWETKDCQRSTKQRSICKMWATKQCPQCIPSMLGTQRNPGQLQHQCRSFQHSPCRNTFLIHVTTVLYDEYVNICEYFWVLSCMIHICLKDKTHIVNITTCFVQRGSYDDSREYLQEAGDRPTHFRDSEKSGRKILSDFFSVCRRKEHFPVQLCWWMSQKLFYSGSCWTNRKFANSFFLLSREVAWFFSHLFKGVTWMSIWEKGNPLVAHWPLSLLM